MKSLFERLNELNTDEEIEPIDVPDEEKQAMKQRIRKKINQQRRVPKIWRNIAAAAVIGVASVMTIGFGFPTLASQIPLVSNIFSIFNEEQDGFYTEYEEFATDVSQAQTSNGVTIMIDRAVYDGKSVTLTYSVETEKELGPNSGVNTILDVEDASGSGGTSTGLQKVEDHKYVGMVTSTPHLKSPQDTVKVTWTPQSIDNMDTMEELKGDWHFQFTLEAITGDGQDVTQSVAGEGIEVTIDSIRFTDISTVIEYSQTVEQSVTDQWEWVTSDLLIKDDLGNEYLTNGNGGFSENGQDYKWSTTIKKIDEQASKLIFTPEIILSEGSGNGHEKLKLDPMEVKLDK
ncbi:DUF4179 domain-containing protein [Sporosarcina sp. ZBG7A]|uniref:DUF4179 domain-containing protein n=1 Tax=Sporosarcina sp. ZBG7A TaxID=1582223 RepID=UPI00057AEDE9|nr:DUF4179 domain-containing protein [Sporosarcina sp. ZBG7A]